MKSKWWSQKYREQAGEGESSGGEAVTTVEETGETIGTNNDARLALLGSINDAIDVERGEDLANINDDGTTEPFRQETAPVDPENDPTGSPANADDAGAADEVERFELKVNGKTLSLTREELIARAQKVESADEYLRTAKQAAKEQIPKEQPPAGPSQEELQRRQDEEDLAMVRAIQAGSGEEAIAALRKLRTQASTRPSISADDVSRTVDERLAFTDAIKRFNSDYDDIVSDPVLKKLALDRDTELLASGDTRPYSERYSEIGESIRAWKQSLAKDIHPAASDMDKREERKAAAPKTPTPAAGKNKPPVQQEDVEESASSVIQSMAKSRGGPQWMRS